MSARAIDTALTLRMHCEQVEAPDPSYIDACLRDSALVRRLTSSIEDKPLCWVWRLVALSEIPFAQRLPYTCQLAQRVLDKLSTPDGFSLSGKSGDLLPCYNAMLTRALARLGYAEHTSVQQALRWILTYQSFERGLMTPWLGAGIGKYGGCLHATPCYIGVVKSVKAMLCVRHTQPSPALQSKLRQGLDYVLQHQLFRRLSDGAPISPHITDLGFPESYQVNLLELLLLAQEADLLRHEAVAPALAIVRQARRPDGHWAPSHVYRADGYVSFDGQARHAPWLDHFLEQILEASQ